MARRYRDPIEARLVLSRDRTSAGVARRFAGTTLDGWECGALADVAALLVSELVTNAIRHARTGVEVVLRLDGDRVRCEVLDGSDRSPVRARRRRDATTGRGLLIVDRLADSWGVERRASGKAVWFELPALRQRVPVG